jgi:hypothetical protein
MEFTRLSASIIEYIYISQFICLLLNYIYLDSGAVDYGTIQQKLSLFQIGKESIYYFQKYKIFNPFFF